MRAVVTLAIAFALSSFALTPSVATDKKPEDPNKKICRRYATTGSILGGKMECHTRAEWASIDQVNADASRRAVSRVTLNPAER
ncbi:MAG: hypothetical protein JWN66_638 [Sphingomonas bacterium]|uniref:hypothetical protein n=1 Tax=Sphingomonas bacterium TaxID=1895847 RepID=UPI00260AB715|nr:hypothetical protein [Sphingomonas bacterium]MDB5703522.1 hypothetical protein [Sphingomonas bacterium]